MSVSIIIPTKDMAGDLQTLLTSLGRENLFAHEILVVNDGSSDATAVVLASFQGKITIVNHEQAVGRFLARLAGAKAARGTHLLFLDTRCEIPVGFAATLAAHLNHDVVQGSIQIPVEESIYNLYWERSHRYMFRHHFKSLPGGFWLTPENFGDHVVGTTIFFCEKNLFLTACAAFASPPLSDDTALIQEICCRKNVWVSESLFVRWRPRQALVPFLARLWERGPNFVSFHVYGSGSPLRKYFVVGLLLILANIAVMLMAPQMWMGFLALQLLGLAFTTLAFTRQPKELIQLAPLHVAVILAFGFGVLKGLWSEIPWRHS